MRWTLVLALAMVACSPSENDDSPQVLVVAPGEGGEWDDPSAKARQVYTTIQAAIDAAGPGDTVHVHSGTFYEYITMKDGVNVEGAGTDETIIEGDLVFSGTTAGTTLSRLTIVSDGSSYAEGIYMFDGGTVTDVKVTGFHRGVALLGGHDTVIQNSEFVFNEYGIWSDDTDRLTIRNNLFRSNSVSGVTNYTTTGVITHNTFVLNAYQGSSNYEYGGALQLGTGDAETVVGNLIVSNFYGINCQDCESVFEKNLVWGNNTNYANDAEQQFADLNLDPQFADPGNHDYRITGLSPAIDAGIPGTAPARDFEGQLRDAAPDIGMDEFLTSDASVLITEVMANATTETVLEFVELYNAGGAPVDLAGMIITDGDDDDTIQAFAGGTTVLMPGAYAVVVDPDYDGSYGIDAGVTVVTTGDTNLGNGLTTSDDITLYEADGETTVATFSYPSDPGDGVSLEMVVLSNGDVSGNWRDSACLDGHSAGAAACFPPSGDPAGLIITEVASNVPNEALHEFVELYNPTELEIDAAALIIDDGDSQDTLRGFANSGTLIPPGEHALILDPGYDYYWSLPNGITLLTTGDQSIGNGLAASDPVTLRTADGVTVIDSFTHTLSPADAVSVEKVDYALGDTAGNWVEADTVCDRGLSPGRWNGAAGGLCTPLFITEVMSNPLDEDTGEFVEIYNAGSVAVDLAGLRLTDPTSEDTLAAYDGGSTVVPPGGYAVVVDAEYAGEYAIPAGATVVSTEDTTLGNALSVTDTLVLWEGEHRIDTYGYPFNAGNGVSVERLSMNATDAAANWVASTCASGSSPGDANCATGGTVGGSGTSTVTVVISEVMANADDEDTGEYVEIYNYGKYAVDLSNFVLWDGDQIDLIFGYYSLNDTVLWPGEYAVILDNEYAGDYPHLDPFALLLTTGDSTVGSGLSTNDGVWLFEPDGTTLIDSFTSPSNPGNAISIEKRDLLGGDVLSNWQASTCPEGNSPGAPNCQ